MDLDKIQAAYNFAEKIHGDVKRKSGEPFVMHPVTVAEIIFDLDGDDDMICAALLHDVLEDNLQETELAEKIEKEFGRNVYFLVQAISKDARIEDRVLKQEKYFEQLCDTLQVNVSVFFLKMADLIHNLKTLSWLEPHKQEKWIQELKTMYLPMLVTNFHHLALPHREMYLNLMDQLESVMEEYETQKNS